MSRIDSRHWKEISPLLDEVLELAGEARAVWLEALRVTRPEAAAELQALLAELQSLDEAGFLQGDPDTLQRLRQVLRKLAGT
jgi:eukaryotic-like serine/threonine-protein kinase